MHLLLLTPHADAPTADRPALAACRSWLERGHTIRLLSRSTGSANPVDKSVHLQPQAVPHPAAVLKNDASRSTEFRASLSRLRECLTLLSRTVTAQGVHLVLADRPDGVSALAAWAARFLRGWPVVTQLDARGVDEVAARPGLWARATDRLVGWCRRGLLRFSSVVVVPDGRVAEEAASLGTPAYRVLRIPESLRLSDWPLIRPRFDYRRLFDSTGRWVLGTAVSANDAPENDLVLEAADLAQERSLANLVIWIVAEGGRRLEMERSARQRGLRNVRFAAQVPAGSLPDLLASCDGWLHSSLHASPGLLLPSMAMNVPVIVPNGLPDVDRIIDADAGLPMVAGDPESLLDCILELRDHAHACRQGRAFVAAHHDADVLTQRTLEVLLQSALPETLPLAAPEPAGVTTEPDRTWKDAA